MIQFVVISGGRSYDMSDIVESIKWSGRKGAAARSVDVTFLDDDGIGHSRSWINVEEGQRCIFSWQGKELFRGMFHRQGQSSKRMLSAIAYDNAIYLANNKNTFHYNNVKASDILIDCCRRAGIAYNGVIDSDYKISDLTKPNTTYWDVICDALSQTYKATGVTYYPQCVGTQIRLIRRSDNIVKWMLELGVNIEDYDFSKSIENIKTRIKLISNEGKVLAVAKDEKLEKKIGAFQDVSQPDDKLNEGKLQELANSMLEEGSTPDITLNVTALGIPDIITGAGVHITIPELGIHRGFYVDEDIHTFRGNYHQMQLKLDAISAVSKTVALKSDGEIKVGDIVNFVGGNHFVSSDAKSPRGNIRKSGPARCTYINKGAKHPYHVEGGAYTNVGGVSNVYGWVDAGLVSKK